MQIKEASNQAARKRITGKALIIFIVMLVLLTFFSNTINNLTLPRVTVEIPMPGDIIKDIGGEGIVEADVTMEKYVSSNMMVKEVKVKAGEQVKKGEPVMTLDTEALEKNLKDETDRYEQKKLQLEKLIENGPSGEFNSYYKNVKEAEKKVQQKQRAYDNLKTLYDMGAESKKNLEDAKAGLEDARQEYETAKLNRQQALKDNERELKSLRYEMDIQQRSIEKLMEEIKDAGSVIAPCDGIIAGVNFTEGTMANSSQSLFKIIDTAKGFRLKVTLDKEKAKYLTVGEEVNITIESVSKRPVKGKITEITDNEQQKGAKKDVYAAVEIEGLTGGEPGELGIAKRIETKGMLISNSAIHTDSTGDYVLVLKEKEGALGKEYYVQKARLTTGESDSSKTAVAEGMRMMERIVVKSSKAIDDGDRVIIEK